jgi:hypothetical protein
MRGYRSSVQGRLVPVFGDLLLDDITPLHIERWRATLPVSPRMKNKLLTEMHGIFKRAAKMCGVTRGAANPSSAAPAPAALPPGIAVGDREALQLAAE